jgi:hypothetical protein
MIMYPANATTITANASIIPPFYLIVVTIRHFEVGTRIFTDATDKDFHVYSKDPNPADEPELNIENIQSFSGWNELLLFEAKA